MANLQPDRAFFRNAILDTIVPEASNARLPEALEERVETDAEDASSLIPITQRTHLFFGKQLPLVWRIIISYSFPDAQMND